MGTCSLHPQPQYSLSFVELRELWRGNGTHLPQSLCNCSCCLEFPFPRESLPALFGGCENKWDHLAQPDTVGEAFHSLPSASLTNGGGRLRCQLICSRSLFMQEVNSEPESEPRFPYSSYHPVPPLSQPVPGMQEALSNWKGQERSSSLLSSLTCIHFSFFLWFGQ